ncbi:hypothetical protein QR680_016600 [Steinernema hermaphroditum]|uniref:TIL domain-containing protein n=1 Tax=Steinernema hermaphroditum TaxID=289476 RepID=A0AA39HDU9_9BILA|nr:hypothetical protein QR680_016600 [Steinernema hermaphroditum]
MALLQMILLFSTVVLSLAVDCPSNEEYMGLGKCEGTCNNPNPECDWISTLFHLIPGCRCRVDKGFVRNGKLSPLSPCIKVKDCPKKETPEPECPENTVFRKCGSCEGTCLRPNPACTAECRKPGCYCPADQGYVRSNVDGGCIPYWQCRRRE